MDLSERAARTLRRCLADMQAADYYPATVLAEAREVLARVPVDGLTPERAKIRAQVEAGAAGLERSIQEATGRYQRALAQLQALPESGKTGSLSRTLAALEHQQAVNLILDQVRRHPNVQSLSMGAAFLSWLADGLEPADKVTVAQTPA